VKNVIKLVFQSEMNGALAFSAKGRGMWTVPPSQRTEGVRFATKSATAVHPTDWPHPGSLASVTALPRG